MNAEALGGPLGPLALGDEPLSSPHILVTPDAPLTGGDVPYYLVRVEHPSRDNQVPYTAECTDIIEALEMDFNEGNAFKALWRMAAKRLGGGKPGTTRLYDAEKVVYFGGRIGEKEKRGEE